MIALLTLALALQVKIGVQATDPDAVRDSIRAARPVRRIPVTPELERTAFRDAAARDLLHRARAARMRQDSALLSYDATAYQRISAGMALRALGRERLLFRTENASRIRWSRDHGTWVDLKGARSVFPMVKDDGGGEVDIDDISPIPYYPGKEALWIGSGRAKAEVDDRELVHPLAIGSEAYYRFSAGDSVVLRLSPEQSIRLRELRVEPRRPEWRMSVGSFWFDAETGQLVRAAYRLAVPIDVWNMVDEEIKREGEEDDVPRWVKGLTSPLQAHLEGVTIEYGLYGGRFWLPRAQTAEGWARASFMRVPFRMEERFRYASVNAVDSAQALPPIPKPPMSLRDSLFGDTLPMSALPREERERRRRILHEADSVLRARRSAARAEQCATSGTHVRYQWRDDRAVRVAVRVPCDTAALSRSPDLPASIYDEGEELFGASERDELIKALDFGLQASWAPQRPRVDYGLDLLRYNRVEGLSGAVRIQQDLGRGYALEAIPRIGLADLQPNLELAGTRSNGRRELRLGLYRRLDAANDWGSPLSFGSSFVAAVFGRDEGFFYRSLGAELVGSNPRGGGFLWRLFAERHDSASVETQASIAHAMNGTRFIDNIPAVEGTFAGAELRHLRTFGLDPAGWRLLSDVRIEGAGGELSYGRAMADLTLSRGFGSRAGAALTAAAGTSVGDLPPQRAWYIGGATTVRGQRASPFAVGHVGDAFWLARGELGMGVSGFRPVVFGDVGWAGARSLWSSPGRPLSGAGVGVSMLDGMIRADLSRGIYPRERMRVDFYLEARF